MTKTDLIVKYMGIMDYLEMIEGKVLKRIDECKSKIEHYGTLLLKVIEKNKKYEKKGLNEKILEKEIIDWGMKKSESYKKLIIVRTQAYNLYKIFNEYNNKEEIPDGIFDETLDLSDLNL